MGSYRRPLHTRILAEEFVKNIMRQPENPDKIINHIIENENLLSQLEKYSTLQHEDYRTKQYRSPEQRKMLHDKILGELINYERLDNDDKIRLGKGGAKPKNIVQESQAYIVTGPPASGKSGIAAQLADATGSYILDSDYAKRKLPEFSILGGASLVHEESDLILFNPDDGLLVYCIYNNNNIVIPLVGKTINSVERITSKLISAGYHIHIINVCLDRFQCTLRAYNRFVKSKRYVPLSYIFDEVGNEPERIYYVLKRKYKNHSNFSSFSQISTDVEIGQPKVITEAEGDSPILTWSDYVWQKEEE